MSLSTKKKKKNETAYLSNDDTDISYNLNSGGENDFTYEKYKEMKEKGQIKFDTDIVQGYFSEAQNLFSDVDNNSANPSYGWAINAGKAYSDTINNLSDNEKYVELYLNSIKDSDTNTYDSLSKQFEQYKTALSQTKDYINNLSGFASQYDNEDEYNKGIFEIQAREKVKGKSYDELMAASRNTDNKYVSNWLKDYANENVSLEEITGKRDKALARQDEVNAQIRKYMDLERAADLPSDKQRYAALLDPLYAEADELTKEIKQNGYDDLIKQKQAEAESKKYAEKYKGLDFNQLLSKISDKNSDAENEWLEKQADSVASSEQLRAKAAELTAEVKHINNELGSGAFEGEEYTEKENQFKRASNALEKYKDLQIIKQREEKAAEYEKLANSPDFAELSKGEWNHIVANDKMTYMTSEEQGIYNYLRNSGKEDEADEYINLIDRRLNERFTQANKEWAENYATEHPWLASAMSLGSNLISGAGIVEDIGKRMAGEPIDVNSPMHYGANLTNALRSTVSDKYLGDVGVFGYDTVMSAADSAVNMAISSAIGGAVGAVAETAGSAAASAIAQKATSTTMSLVMGSQVATNTVIDAKERGLTDDQAVTLGVLYGIAETISEKYSIEKWMKDPVSVGSVLKKSFIAEGTEEIAANWLDRAADCLVSGDKSEINQKYKDYINQGFSDKESLTMTLFGMVGEDTTSFLAGGLSGLAMSGVHMAATGAVSEARYAKSEHKSVNELLKPENKDALNKLIKAGKEFDEDSDNYKLAERIEKASADGEKISTKDVKKLRRAVVQQAYKDTAEDIKKLYSVTEGMNDDQRAVVGYVGDKLRRGQSLTNQENAMIRNDGEILKAVSGYIEKDENDVIDMLDAAKFKDNFKYYSSNGNGLLEVDGNEFRGTVEIKSTNPANGRLTLNLIDDNGNSRTISSDDVDFKNDTEAKLYSIAANFSNPNEANAFVENYEGGDLNDYLTEWNLFSNYGRLGYNRNQIYQRSQLDTDTKVRQAAYYSGMEAFKSFAQAQYLNEQAYEATAQSFKGYQRGTFVNNVSSERLNKMSRAQRKSIRELKMFTFAGLNVELFESKTDKNGNFIGENGSFDAKTKTLRVDINAGFENNSRAVEEATRAYIRLTAAHELTHAAEQGGGYMKLRAEIVRTLEAAGFDYKKLVDKKFNQLSSQDKYKGIAKDKLYRLADEETIADCCETLLNDSKVFEKLYNYDKSFAERFINAVKRAIEKLRQFFKENPTYARTEYGKALQEAMSKVENRVQELWDEAVAQGIRAENKNAATEGGTKSQDRGSDYVEYDKPINRSDIDALHDIGKSKGKLSVNRFNSKEIQATQKWAHKFYQQLGDKSPFFRAWFGDWRVNETTPIEVAEKQGAQRGTVKNKDTGWNINVSRKVFNETKSHNGQKNIKAQKYLPYINDIIEKAVLLDTVVSDKYDTQDSLFMHNFYAVADIGNGKELLKLYVEEMNNVNSTDNTHRAYQLQNIEKQQLGVTGSELISPSRITQAADIKNIADLFVLVKQNDSEFNPTEPSKVVDKDGKPLVVYHQTGTDFTVFDTEIKGAGYYDDETPVGIFLKPSDSDIGINGKKQMPLYASIKNPLKVNNRQELVKYYEKNIDGYTDKKNAINNLESEYHKRFEEEMKRENEEYQKQWEAWRRGDITEEDYRKATDRSGAEKVMEEWERDENALRRELKQIISDYLKKSKYDGVIIEQDSGSFGRSTKTYIAFDNTQVKSATDNIGTYDRNNADINYSDRFNDTDYLSAVERGDMATAQQMVDEAAKAAGYDMHLYHGAKSGGGFTVFKDWQYFTKNKPYAERYTQRETGKGLYDVFVKSSRMFDTRNADDRAIFEQYRNEYGMSELTDNGLPDWTDGYDLSEIIEENNLDYDGIILNEGGDLVNGKPVSRGASFVIRKSSQIKSADPVTYDDDGNVIPLSERFNEEQEDIRYQDRIYNEGKSDRELLAEAMEGIAKNDFERETLQRYKSYIDKINKAADELIKVNKKIKDISFTKGSDRSQLPKLNAQKKKLENQISYWDKKLINSFESAKPLKDLFERGRKEAFRRQREKSNKRLKDYQENARKRTLYDRIAWNVKRLNKFLDSADPNKRVKEGLRDINEKILKTSQYLLYDNLSTRDIVRNGVENATPEEQKLLKQYHDIIGNVDHKLTDAERETLKDLRIQLKDLINREKAAFEKGREELFASEFSKSLVELQEAYKLIKDSDLAYIRDAYDDAIVERIEEFKKEIDKTLSKDLTSAQLEDFRKIVAMIAHTISRSNKLHASSKSYTETAQTVMSEIEGNRKTKEIRRVLPQFFGKTILWNNFKPVYAIRYIGSKELEKIYWKIQQGELDWMNDIEEARNFLWEMKDKYDYKHFDMKLKKTFKAANGTEFELTKDQMFAVYVLSRREQALQHLLKGGFTFPKGEKAKGGKHTGSTSYPLNAQIIADITNELSDNEKHYAEALQKYLSEVMAKKGNEVSMELYGVELFNEDSYWSIQSSADHRQVDTTEQKGQFMRKNAGFTKATVRNASNPIVLNGFERGWADHVNEMSLYHATTLPIEDFSKVLNYNARAEENKTVKNVRTVLNGSFGEAATDYFNTFLKDINGGFQVDSRENLFDTFVSGAKKAAVMLNLSVVLQQPMAAIRAMNYISPRFFLPVKLPAHSSKWEQLKKYAKVASIKEMGIFDVGIGQGAVEWINTDKRQTLLGDGISGFVKAIGNNAKDIVVDSSYRDEVLSRGASYADEVAWLKIWNAVQHETKAKYGYALNSEKNLIKSGERFNEVVHLTQVYDSVLTRSHVMRSKSTFLKMVTAFMAEPTTVVNMAVDAGVQSVRKKSAFPLLRAGATLIVSMLLNNLMKSITGAMRDDDDKDDEGNVFIKYRNALNLNILNDMIAFNYFPILRDVMSLIEGYHVDRMDMTLVSNVINAAEKIAKNGFTVDTGWNLAGRIFDCVGIPLYNVVRDVRSVFNTYNKFRSQNQTVFQKLGLEAEAEYQSKYDKYWAGGEEEEKCESKAKSAAKTKITNTLKPLYLKALKQSDPNTIYDIRTFMRDLGYYDSLNDVDKALERWRKGGEEEEEKAKRAEERK